MSPGTEQREEFGRRLKRSRQQKRMTRPALERATGIPVNTIRQYELGKSWPSAHRLVKLAEVLEVEPGWLVAVEMEGEK